MKTVFITLCLLAATSAHAKVFSALLRVGIRSMDGLSTAALAPIKNLTPDHMAKVLTKRGSQKAGNEVILNAEAALLNGNGSPLARLLQDSFPSSDDVSIKIYLEEMQNYLLREQEIISDGPYVNRQELFFIERDEIATNFLKRMYPEHSTEEIYQYLKTLRSTTGDLDAPNIRKIGDDVFASDPLSSSFLKRMYPLM